MTSPPKLSASQSQPSLTSSPIPQGLQDLETHAQDMASLLDNLVSHFDLCVTAIRHTEGGFAAVRKAASSLPPGAEPVSVSGVMDSSKNFDDEGPLSEEERMEMLGVVENDAAQVEDVVTELREHLSEMETKHDAILNHVSNLTATYDSTVAAFSALETLSAHLRGYLMAASDFEFHWREIKSQIEEQLQEMESMRLFYENYHASYDSLIMEVYRRKQSEEKVKSIMRKAMEQIEKVVEVDTRERTAFRSDVGDFLPGDLWGGVTEAAPRWEFAPFGNEEGEKGIEAPQLERAVVEGAARRDRERQRLQR
jgi:autophagy-related protein 17